MIAALKKIWTFGGFARIGAGLRTLLVSAARSPRLQAWWNSNGGRAVVASLLLHVSLAACAAFSMLHATDSSLELSLNSNWTSTENGPLDLPVEISAIESAPQPAVSGGSTGHVMTELIAPRPEIANPLRAVFASASRWDDASLAELGRTVGSPTANTGNGRGKGQGSGNGIGDGKQFFGLAAEGKSFVYVLDCSLSMNHPHDSEFKTRFRRLKQELTNSVANLKPDQEFFIVFFNHEAIPMPADRPVSASLANQQHYLGWMEQVPAFGDTDPTAALQLALRLRPDVIYFLTDGSFSTDANEIVKTIHQSQTAIHTFSFEPWLTEKQRAGIELMRQKKASAAMQKLGEATYRRTREVFVAEQVLHGLAEHNGGKFHVIP